MRRSLLARVLALFLASTAALAAPSSALAHGEAHHHAAEHDDVPASADASASAPDHGAEHDHPRLEGTTRTRVNEFASIVPPPVVLPGADVLEVPVAVVRSDEPAGGDPSTGPPPRLRAPPTR